MSRVILKKATQDIKVTMFLDYKEYLASLFNYVKSNASPYSYTQFAEDLGFSHSNVIWLVITGRRKLSDSGIQRIVYSLGLSGIDRRYFSVLVHHNNARLGAVRDKFQIQLFELKTKELESPEEQEKLEYFAEWYYPVLREMTGTAAFKSDPTWISENIYGKLLPKEITYALKLLEKLKLIAFSPEKGRYEQVGGQIKPDRKVGKMASVRFHEKMLDIAKESITRVPQARRDFNAMTICVSDETADKIKELTQEFCKKILEIEQDDLNHADQVYQLNIQLFPFTKKSKSNDDEGESK